MQGRRMWRLRILAAGLALLVASAGIEVVLQGVYFVRGMKAYRKSAVAKTDSSPAYTNSSEYYGAHAVFPLMEYNSYLGYVPRRSHEGDGYRTNNRHQRYDDDLNFQPAANEVRVFVTGGSATWGAGVTQEQHFATVTEARFAEESGPEGMRTTSVRVVPAAAGGHTSTNERIWIQNLLGELSPEVVVMLSGWNDTYATYRGVDTSIHNDFMRFGPVLAREMERIDGVGADGIEAPPQSEDYLLKTHYLWAKAAYARRYDEQRLAEEIEARSVSVERVVERLVENVQMAADYARRRGFRLVFCLQPSLYGTAKQLTPYERELLEDYEQRYPGFAEYNAAAYAGYREAVAADAEASGYLFWDGDAAISASEESVFADHVHLGDRGNRMLGEYLHSQIRPLLVAGRDEVQAEADAAGVRR